MSEYLVIRLSNDSSNVTWMILDSIGKPISEVTIGSLPDIDIQAENRLTILLVPGTKAVSIQTTLPITNKARSLKMLPYSLEDMVAEDIELLHFALGSRLESGETAGTFVSRDEIDGWIQQCADAGLSPQFIYSETEGIPEIPGRLTFVIDGHQTYVRTEEHKYFVLEGLSLVTILELLSDSRGDKNSPHILIYTDEDGYSSCKSDLPTLQERTSSIDIEILPDGPLQTFASTLISHPGNNLLQGKYASKSNWSSLIKPWRLAASLLISLGVLIFITQGVRLISLTNNDQTLSQSLEASCQSNFQSTQLSTCQAEAQRRLSPVSTTTDSETTLNFLSILATFSDAFNQDSRIEALTFRNGVMDLRIDSSSVASLDELARVVDSNNLYDATIQSANPADDRVAGRLQITGEQ